ncbi:MULTISPECIES: LicD family protein [Blautia]|uniref:LicD family protein n=1 Tax=Blautia TaxID=572511 RepID=UPI001D067906|nr:LicD family protein [Blautia marasmi]MCB6194992.1 LicD family protein [Blautia marasmi]
MYREYDEKILTRIKNTEKDILLFFQEICDKHQLKYFVAFGTLLGTIRHNGFIPWDDDIDVAMPRKDYTRFLEIMQQGKYDKYFLQIPETDDKYHLTFAKLRMKGTRFLEERLVNADAHEGFYIDIFPYDNIPDDDFKAKKLMKKCAIWIRLFSVSRIKEPQIGNRGTLNFLVKLIWYVLYYFLKLIPSADKYIWNKCNQYFTAYQNVNTARMTLLVSEPEKWIVYGNEIEQTDHLRFEDITVAVPRGFDAILNRNYGNYMELPPKEQRVNHVPVEVQFPDEEVIILKK